MKTISSDIFEPEMPEIKFIGGGKALFAYLQYYSKYFENDQKKSDLDKVNELSNKRFDTITGSSNSLITTKARKSSLFTNINRNRSSLVNKSLGLADMEKLNNILKNSSEFEFNVFELDKIVGKKTLIYTVTEVFEKYSELEVLVDEKHLKKFLTFISDNYYRTNPYHNDLHAADVFQTTYVVLMKGNIVDVSNLIILIAISYIVFFNISLLYRNLN